MHLAAAEHPVRRHAYLVEGVVANQHAQDVQSDATGEDRARAQGEEP